MREPVGVERTPTHAATDAFQAQKGGLTTTPANGDTIDLVAGCDATDWAEERPCLKDEADPAEVEDISLSVVTGVAIKVSSHTKYADLANYIPDDAGALADEVVASLHQISTEQQLLRSFLHHAKLRL